MKSIHNKFLSSILALVFFSTACMDDGADYDPVTNVPEGVYITGSASQFAVEAIKGKFTVLREDTLSALYTWLRAGGDFKVSIAGDDGVPVRYGAGTATTDGAVTTCALSASGAGFTVPADGLYHIVVNTLLNQASIVAIDMQLFSPLALGITEGGSISLPFSVTAYDNLTHTVTWKTANTPKIIYSNELRISYTEGSAYTVPLDAGRTITFRSSLTGAGRGPNENLLSDELMPVSVNNTVNMKLAQSGNYIMEVKFVVLTGAFTVSVNGESIPEPPLDPEATGYTPTLYMTRDTWGAASVEMFPISWEGTPGSGVFWTIANFADGEGVKWSPGNSSTGEFAALDNNVGFTVSGGYAVPETPGWWLIYIDMDNDKIAFDEPAVFGTASCFNGDDVQMELDGQMFTTTTLSVGHLRMFAATQHNGRRPWTTMEFNIYDGKIVPRGISLDEQEIVPVYSDVPIELNFAAMTGKLDVTLSASHAVDLTAAINQYFPLYMIADVPYYGDMNWGSPNVVQMHYAYQQNARYWGVYYFPAGTGLRWSRSKFFGDQEFVELEGANEGFTVIDGKAVVATAGTYSVFIDLSAAMRAIYIEPGIPVVYGPATPTSGDNPGTLMTDLGEGVFSYTVDNNGRIRFQTRADVFYASPAILNPACTGWRREYAMDYNSDNIFFREGDANEPNANETVSAGEVITIDFKTGKYTRTGQ